MTLLIADNNAPESDYIDVDWEDFSRNLLQLEQFLGVGVTGSIAQLTASERTEMGGLFADFSGLIGTPFELVFAGLFRSRLPRDKEMLNKELAPFLTRLENLLKSFAMETFQTHLGQNWFHTVKTVAGECGVKPEKSPAQDYTLHDYITVVDKLVSSGMVARESVEETLGGDWKARLDALRNVRNAVQHGRLFEDSYAEQSWGDIARKVCSAADIYNSLQSKYGRDKVANKR
jgi:hypothetical protein